MKAKHFILAAVAAVTLLTSCGTTQTVPVTGRTHRISVSDSEVLSLSTQEYTQYMSQAKKSTNVQQTALVQKVGTKMAAAVEAYLRNNGYASEIANFKWEFNLVENSAVNAFCMPGGKIVVYEGLLPYTQDETGLAIVMGHEIAHAVAKHSAEQMTTKQNQAMGTTIGAGILGAVVGNKDLGNLAGTVAGQYFSFRNLKYSRDNELEADHMGLIFAAMAGYDPQKAIPFWQRMSGGKSNGNDMFSDHPSDEKRIAQLQAKMSEALKYYTPPVATVQSQQTSAASSKKTTSKKTTSKKTRK